MNVTPEEADAAWREARDRLAEQQLLVAIELPDYPDDLPDPLPIPLLFSLLRLNELEWLLVRASHQRLDSRGNTPGAL